MSHTTLSVKRKDLEKFVKFKVFWEYKQGKRLSHADFFTVVIEHFGKMLKEKYGVKP